VNRSPSFTAIILAAGSSSRMGFPKPLLEYQGERFIDRLLRIFRAVCAQVIIVRSIASGEWNVDSADFVTNPQPERGMLSSLQCGLREVSNESDAIFFTPVDYPAISESTVKQLAEAWAGASIVIPRHQGRRGHPVLIARVLVPEFLDLPHTAQPRDVVRRHGSSIRYVDVDDPGILLDVDTPEQHRALESVGL
jgi:CTP:molybdopterin cytidylyltransferase MocA